MAEALIEYFGDFLFPASFDILTKLTDSIHSKIEFNQTSWPD